MNKSTLEVTYQLTTPNKWYQRLNTQLSSRLEENEFILGRNTGKGNLKNIDIQDGLWVYQMNFLLYNDLKLHQTPKAINDCYILNFYLSKSKIRAKAKDKNYELGLESVNIVLSSSMTNLHTFIPADQYFHLFNIGFSHKWLMKNVFADNNSDLKQIFEQPKPIYIAESLDFKLKHIIQTIDLDNINRLTLFANVLQILDDFFSRLHNRVSKNIKLGNIHFEDFNRLMEVRNLMDEQLDEPVSVENLAQNSGMSLSKFKRLFKQVFGTTPYRYHWKNRMEKAMEMLATGKKSVTETGMIIGYTNLSQFAKAFKKHFGMLPSEVKIAV